MAFSSPTVDVINFLTEEGIIGDSTDWAGASNYLPDDQDKVIAVFDTAGEVPEKKQACSEDEIEYDEGRFQIRGRSSKFGMEALQLIMRQIYHKLHGSELSPNEGDPKYVYVFAVQSSPLSLGLDGNSRPSLTWNFTYMRERHTDL